PAGQRILTVDLKSMQHHVLASLPPLRRIHPVMSGDGRVIAFYGSKGSYLVPVEDGGVTQLCQNCGGPTHVSFDGSQWLFESLDNDDRLLLWSKGTTGRLTPDISPKDEMQYGGHFSPDGNWVAYCKRKSGSQTRQIVVVPNSPHQKLRPDDCIMISDGGDSD